MFLLVVYLSIQQEKLVETISRLKAFYILHLFYRNFFVLGRKTKSSEIPELRESLLA